MNVWLCYTYYKRYNIFIVPENIQRTQIFKEVQRLNIKQLLFIR